MKTPASARARRRARPDGLLLLILLIALSLRIWGITDRLPDPKYGVDPMSDTVVDEGDRRVTLYAWEMWHGGVGPVDLNPKTGDWPGLPFYTELGVQLLDRALFALLHPGSTAAQYAAQTQAGPARLFLEGRLFSVLAGLVTIVLVGRIGRTVGGRATGLLAALLLAVAPAHVLMSQRVVDPNLLALLFVSAATLAALRFTDTGAARDSIRAGAWIGLAAACKYLPGVLAVLPLVAGLGRARSGKAPSAAPAWKEAAAGALVAPVVFLLVSPFTLLDWGAKARDMGLQRSRLQAEWVGQSQGGFALVTYLVHTLPSMMTWPLYLAAVAGSVLLWRSGARGRLVVAVAGLLLLANGVLGVAQDRFILPALGSLCVAAAYAARRAAESLAHARPRARLAQAVPYALAALVALAGSGLTLLPVRRALALEDSRHVARRWIDGSIPPEAPMAVDLYGPVLPSGPTQRRALEWPFLATQAERVRPAYHPEWLDGFAYYLTSSEVTRRFEAARARYPLENAFYDWIRRHGARVWTSDSARASGPAIEIWKLPDSTSSPEARDRLWESETRGRAFGSRLARWCGEMAQLFAWNGEFGRGEEWARRSLMLNQAAGRQLAYEVLTFSLLQRNRPRDAEASAREGILEFPRAELLRVYRGMALAAAGDRAGALAAYREALPVCSTDASRGFVQSEIDRLQGAGTSR